MRMRMRMGVKMMDARMIDYLLDEAKNANEDCENPFPGRHRKSRLVQCYLDVILSGNTQNTQYSFPCNWGGVRNVPRPLWRHLPPTFIMLFIVWSNCSPIQRCHRWLQLDQGKKESLLSPPACEFNLVLCRIFDNSEVTLLASSFVRTMPTADMVVARKTRE